MTDDIGGKILKKLSRVLSSGKELYAPPGHYYSPIVSIDEIKGDADRLYADKALPRIDLDGITAFFDALSKHFPQIRLADDRETGRRYRQKNKMFGAGEALLLSAFIREVRPKRVIEVGCGFSSALALDTADELPAHRIDFTFVDPNLSDRFEELLRPEDRSRVRIIEAPIQTVDLSLFDELESGDLLFLDTTHISKTGSDLNYEIFDILPRLAPGVFVHFHDIFSGWEYPRDWILKDNRSWNELYILRAFLMYNNTFDVVLFNDALSVHKKPYLESKSLYFSTWSGAGSGLYLKKKHM